MKSNVIEISRRLIRNTLLLLPMGVLEYFEKRQFYKIEIINDGTAIKMTAVQADEKAAAQAELPRYRTQGFVYIKRLENGKKINIPTPMIKKLRLESGARMMIRYEQGTNEIMLTPVISKCWKCQKAVEDINDKHIIFDESKKRILICKDCAKQFKEE